MDTADVAEHLGTTPRVLRQFLRSPKSTFASVGSGARYDFNTADLPTLKKRFVEWSNEGKPKATPAPGKRNNGSRPKQSKDDKQRALDERIWAEEGAVVIEDIRDPHIRARVRADARAAEERLEALLMAKGRHLTQLGDAYVSQRAS